MKLIESDCIEAMAAMDAASVDAIICDPPYGLSREPDIADVLTHWLAGDDYEHRGGGFMGKTWDSFVPGPAYWREAIRVLKPGGHLLAFGGTRTYDLLAIAVRIAGFEIRDSVMWLYGSGFPKSLDVSKAIDKRREDVEDVRVVCRWLRRAIDGTPETVATVAMRFGFHPRMVEHWAARNTDSQPALPTLEQWDALRDLLHFSDEMDAEVLRLNLRKGEPGEAWAERPVTGVVEEWANRSNYALTSRDGLRRDTAVGEEAQRWQGWGTALKPGHEPVVVARKPLIGTVAANVLEHGTGALNVDGCRIGHEEPEGTPRDGLHGSRAGIMGDAVMRHRETDAASTDGRWPANLILSHAEDCVCVGERRVKAITGTAAGRMAGRASGVYGDYVGSAEAGRQAGLGDEDGLETVEAWECAPGCPVAALDAQSGRLTSGNANVRRESGSDQHGNTSAAYGAESRPAGSEMVSYGDTGGASRFFYCAKASKAERNAGLEHFAERRQSIGDERPSGGMHERYGDVNGSGSTAPTRNPHPTVKPIALMRWLVKLVTPPGGVVLDPFMGSGSTGIAAALEGFDFIGIEREPEYMPIARERIAWWAEHPRAADADKPIKRQAPPVGQGGLF